MKYAQRLEKVASELKERGTTPDDKRRRKFLTQAVDDFSTAACAGDVVMALKTLSSQYAAQYRMDEAEPAHPAGVVTGACQALAHGDDPESIAISHE